MATNRMRKRSSSVAPTWRMGDRKSTRLNSSHLVISYAVFCLKKKSTKLTRRIRLPAVIFAVVLVPFALGSTVPGRYLDVPEGALRADLRDIVLACARFGGHHG